MKEKFLKNIREIGLGTLLLMLVSAITWVVNQNNNISNLKADIERLQKENKADVERLEREKFDESKTRFIIQQETFEMKGDLRDIKNWIYDKVKK